MLGIQQNESHSVVTWLSHVLKLGTHIPHYLLQRFLSFLFHNLVKDMCLFACFWKRRSNGGPEQVRVKVWKIQALISLNIIRYGPIGHGRGHGSMWDREWTSISSRSNLEGFWNWAHNLVSEPHVGSHSHKNLFQANFVVWRRKLYQFERLHNLFLCHFNFLKIWLI